MGGVPSRAGKHVARTWNVENRAHKVIDKMQENPELHVEKVAPKHETTKQLLEDFQREHPEALEEQRKKHEGLHGRLKGMEVNPEKFADIRPKLLPESRKPVSRPDFGYQEPPKIPLGRCSVRQALSFVDSHQIDPEKHSAEKIAEEYNLDPEKVAKTLQYFKMYLVQMPKPKTAAGRWSRLKLEQAVESLPPSRRAETLAPGRPRIAEGDPQSEEKKDTASKSGEKD